MHSNDRRARAVTVAAVAAGALALAAAPANATVAPAITDRVLTVTGDAAADKLTLRVPASAPTQLELDLGDNGTADFRFPRSAFDQVRVLAGDGDDVIRVETGVRGAALPLTVDGQGGNDALLGAGSATFDGGAGFDRFAFTGSDVAEDFRLAASATRARLTRDIGAVTVDLGTVERVDLAVRGGNDLITLDDVTGSGVQELRTDLTAAADSGTDRIVVDGTAGNDFISILGGAQQTPVLGGSAFLTLTGAEPARDRLLVNGQAGRDRIDATAGASTPLLVVDGGAGDDSISGTNADDVLNGGAGRDDVDPERGNDVVGLGADDDTFLYSAGDGTDSVEGGTGRDGAVGIDAGSVEALSVFSFGGADRLSVGDLTGTSLDTINASMFDFGVPGGNNDVVTVAGSAADDAIFVTGSGTNATVSGLQAKLGLTGLASDRLEVNAQRGKDTIDSTALAATPLAFRGDGGAGDDVLDGGSGADVLIGNAGADVLLNGEVVFDN